MLGWNILNIFKGDNHTQEGEMEMKKCRNEFIHNGGNDMRKHRNNAAHAGGNDMKAHKNTAKHKWIMTDQVYTAISQTIGRCMPEQGGILGSSDGIHIDHYYFDKNAWVTGSTYTFDTETLNRVIAQWNEQDIRFVGVIHSHPRGCNAPSQGDMAISRTILESMDMDGRIFTPIVQVGPKLDGTITIYPYTFEQTVVMKRQPLDISRDSEKQRAVMIQERDAQVKNRFQRIKGILPPEVMARKMVICVGCGGSRPFLADLARCGVGTFVLVEADRVEDTNIATQGVFVREMGMLKTAAIKQELEDINPTVQVVAISRFLDDNMSDEEFAGLTGITKRAARDVLLCGCTDNFRAQDRCAQLAMKFGVPYLAAQVYAGGTGSEVLFTYPGVTHSCPRCILEPRYRRALVEKEQVNGKSEGSPIMTTTKLNGTKGTLALQLLLYSDEESPYAHQLDAIAGKNFLMTRNSRNLAKLGVSLFDGFDDVDAELEVTDITVAIEQTPNEGCPMCGGTGDLRKLIGRPRDTRYIPTGAPRPLK